jgi:AcrR family transcriptional regulator
METSRTSAGDPRRSIALLWRANAEDQRRRGPRPRLSVDEVVDAAIEVADADGLASVTIRAVAARLGASPMTVYTYVETKAELLDLMVDAVYVRMPRPPWPRRQGWRTRVRAVADANRDLYEAHPWAARVSTARPPLGPGLIEKYEHELAALDGLGLTDLEMDAALTFVLGFVRQDAIAAQESAENDASGSDADWWVAAGPELARFVEPARYPLASRVGSAAGSAQGAAYSPARAYEFGLERVLDGLSVLIEERVTTP